MLTVCVICGLMQAIAITQSGQWACVQSGGEYFSHSTSHGTLAHSHTRTLTNTCVVFRSLAFAQVHRRYQPASIAELARRYTDKTALNSNKLLIYSFDRWHAVYGSVSGSAAALLRGCA